MLPLSSFPLCLLESVLTQSADGADPIFGNIVPFGAGSNAVFGIAGSGIILITAGAYILFHHRVLLCPHKLGISRNISSAYPPEPCRGGPHREPFHQSLRCARDCGGKALIYKAFLNLMIQDTPPKVNGNVCEPVSSEHIRRKKQWHKHRI